MLKLRGAETDLANPNVTVSNKSAHIAAKKISYKYKKMRRKKTIDLVQDVQEAASKKSTQIVAKKFSKKYRKMRNKRPAFPFNFDYLEEESVVYDD